MTDTHLRELARALAPYLREHLEASPDFYDQKTSPLGSRKHRELCRTGKLPNTHVGQRYIVSRAAMEAYLQAVANPVVEVDPVQATLERIARSMKQPPPRMRRVK